MKTKKLMTSQAQDPYIDKVLAEHYLSLNITELLQIDHYSYHLLYKATLRNNKRLANENI